MPRPDCDHKRDGLPRCCVCNETVCDICVAHCWVCDEEFQDRTVVYCEKHCRYICNEDSMEYHGGHFDRACGLHDHKPCPQC